MTAISRVFQVSSPASSDDASNSGVATVTLLIDDHDPITDWYLQHYSGRQDGKLLVASSRCQELEVSCREHADSIQLQPLNESIAGSLAGDLPIRSVALLTRGRFDDRHRQLIQALSAVRPELTHCRMVFHSSLVGHFLTSRHTPAEQAFLAHCPTGVHRTTLFRTGLPLGASSSACRWIARLSVLAPLFGPSLRSCFVGANDVIPALRDLTHSNLKRLHRVLTVPGTNRCWRSVLRSAHRWTPLRTLAFGLITLLAWLGMRLAFTFLLKWVAGRFPPAAALRIVEFEPRSTTELLALYNSYSFMSLKLAGYNTGVNHFGWRFPGRTVVLTHRTGRSIRSGRGFVRVDAGTLLKDIQSHLAERGEQLQTMPNYSYVTAGTSFFVPIHGNSSEVSTLGETITHALLYDPCHDCFHTLSRDMEEFHQLLYDIQSPLLLLRLTMTTRPSVTYAMDVTELTTPSAEQIWTRLSDTGASHLEIRKHRASDQRVNVIRFTEHPVIASEIGSGQSLPRDSIGSLWDRIEQHRLAAWCFHTLIRRYAFHVELLLTRRQFDIFWNTHTQLPLKKIQLRWMHRDGIAHSACCHEPCVSVDLFMWKYRSERFREYCQRLLPDARTNPGKQSLFSTAPGRS